MTMFRIRRIHYEVMPVNKTALNEVRQIFREQFPDAAKGDPAGTWSLTSLDIEAKPTFPRESFDLFAMHANSYAKPVCILDEFVYCHFRYLAG